MKKKSWIWIVAVIVLLAVLFVPVPRGPYKDGGTREYVALTYRIVAWKRLVPGGVYEKTCVYFGADRNRSIDALFSMEYEKSTNKMIASVLEINGETVLAEPVPGQAALQGSDKISFSIKNFDDIGASVGSVVEVTYIGGIMETYPAQINATGWKLSTDLRHLAYTDTWLDKETAEKHGNDFFDHIIITEIYSNCFFAESVVPMPYKIKLNCTLTEEWCVGDQVITDHTNVYFDRETNRVEADVESVRASDWQPDPNKCYKPVIYLYPTEETEVSVNLNLSGKLTCAYPAYGDGWRVTAAPDGTLTDGDGMTYNYLYWEGETDARYDLSRGFCVPGGDTAAFLEDALEKLGLTRREANEFIVYWLPLMQNNPYNIISFQTDAYTDAAKLLVKPSPDTVIRVFMAWQAAEEYVELEGQELSAPKRAGFTVVEWGGTEIK